MTCIYKLYQLTCRDLPIVALSQHVKIRGLLMSEVVFAVNRYECLIEIESKNIRTFIPNFKKKAN